MKVADLGFMVSAGAVGAVRKHLPQTIHRLALPGAHLVRMNLVLRRDLLDRPVATQGFKGHPGFKVCREPASCRHRRIPPLNGGIHLNRLSDFPGPPQTEALTGREIERAYVDKGYRGHDAPNPWRVFKSGQKRGVHGQIKKELRRRSAIEAVIGHCKTDGHLDRNFLKGRLGDHINAVMSAVGYNLRLILKWLRKLLREIIAAILMAITPFSAIKTAS